MDFAFSADQQELRTAVRRLLAERLPAERLHALADEPDRDGAFAGYDGALWSELVGLGWVGVSMPDGGGTFLDEAVLLEEAGLALLPAPLLSGVVATPALDAAGADATRRTAVAWGELRGPASFGDAHEIAARAEAPAAGSDRWTLTGTKSDVADLGSAEQVVVLARTPEGPGAFLVDLTEPADHAAAAPLIGMLDTTDGTRRIGQLVLDGVPAIALAADSPSVSTVLRAMRRRAHAALALESVGVAQWALTTATAHASQREQFGRVIGSYQAISHRIADTYVRTELARSLAYRAAWFVATSETEPDEVDPTVVDSACAAAKAAGTEAAVFATEAVIQVLGGIGMTWEHLAHRYYKRALASRTYAGAPAEHRATVAAALLDH